MSGAALLSKRYQLVAQLGAGGMGSVWKARDLTLDADVAVKLMDPQLVGSALALARFRREARAAAAIRSSYVVQILDFGVDGNVPFIAMELLSGESLAHRLKSSKTLTPEVTARLLGHVGRALSLAHAQGIVHRDLKPDNIFLVREGDEELGKVLDFGVARRNEGFGQNSGLETQTGALLGTPFYMSPEQAGADEVDARTDVWAYGVVACECLTGTRPFRGENLGGLFRAICMDEPPIPSALGSVPRGFDEWFAKATARDKAARYASITEAANDLRSLCLHPASSAIGSAARDAQATVVQHPAPQAPTTLEQTGPAAALSVAKNSPHKSQRALWLVLAAGVLGGTGYLALRSAQFSVEPSAANASAGAPVGSVVSASSPSVEPATTPPTPPALVSSAAAPPSASSSTAPATTASASASPGTVSAAPKATPRTARTTPATASAPAPTAQQRDEAERVSVRETSAAPAAPVSAPTPSSASSPKKDVHSLIKDRR